MLKATITIVHANSSGVKRYILALYNSFPIEFLASPIISAATPAFHAMPIAIELAESVYGIILGI